MEQLTCKGNHRPGTESVSCEDSSQHKSVEGLGLQGGILHNGLIHLPAPASRSPILLHQFSLVRGRNYPQNCINSSTSLQVKEEVEEESMKPRDKKEKEQKILKYLRSETYCVIIRKKKTGNQDRQKKAKKKY
jgi:hypothetical protein